MYWVTNSYQQVIAYGTAPSLEPFIFICLGVMCLLLLGFFLFIRASSDIVDAL
jgi:ABC-type polysaccharide/polyol phosphate export permease